jgi:serine/threonine-protein kinase mTOR
MLVNAMEVSGIEGNFRFTCDSVMRVLREHRDSVMAMLEAFVHDPLINWRLLTPPEHTAAVASGSNVAPGAPARPSGSAKIRKDIDDEAVAVDMYERMKHMSLSVRGAEGVVGSSSHRTALTKTFGSDAESVPSEALNGRAVAVIRRVNAKLTGRDFSEVGCWWCCAGLLVFLEVAMTCIGLGCVD